MVVTENVDWSKELQDLVASAKTSEDIAATTAFAQAIEPYLRNPELLRTLLGKIAMAIPSEAFKIVVGEQAFADLDELQAKLPENIEIVGLK